MKVQFREPILENMERGELIELIQAQKDFDTAVANVKKEAPYGGEWKSAV